MIRLYVDHGRDGWSRLPRASRLVLGAGLKRGGGVLAMDVADA